MAPPKRLYHKGERPHSIKDNRHGSNKFNQYFYVRPGRIEDIDLDRYEMTIQWLPYIGVRDKVPISFPYAGPAGIIGMLPEKGAIGIFAFYDEGEGKGNPLCVGYLPAGLDTGLNFNNVKILPDSLPSSDVNEIFYKFRKLSLGDVIISSPLFSTLFLNKNVELHDAAQDSIVIKEDDQSIIATSLNNFIFADGVSVNMGTAIRNGLSLYDKAGKKLANNGSLSDSGSIFITSDGGDITYDTQFYTEYRIDVDEYGDGKLDLNDINSSSPLSTKNPIVSFALGNYIGANKFNPDQYGLNLKVHLFKSKNDKKGGFGLERAGTYNGVDEPSTIGLAYALHFLKTDCLLGIDKEGHYYMNLPASKVNPLGAGRSMSILAQGNLKEIWGASAEDANSWDLSTNGGVIWDLGAHSPSRKSRSFEMTTSRGIYLNIKGQDDDGYARREDIIGDTLTTVSGTHATEASELALNINGLKIEYIGGSSDESVQSDKTVNVFGVYKETVVKEKQCQFGKRKVTITTGNDELEVMKGNIKESITTFGKRIIEITSGGIEETLRSGTYKTTVNLGSYKINVGSGSIEIKSSLGTITMSGTSIDIKATALVNINAPLVKVGKGALVGGVVSGLPGKPNHNDYVVGVPLKGSMKVSVG